VHQSYGQRQGTLRAASRATAAAPAAAASRCSSRTRAFHLAALARAAAVAAAAAVVSDATAPPRRPPSAAPCEAGAHDAAGRQVLMRPNKAQPNTYARPTLRAQRVARSCTGAGRASRSSTGCGAGPGRAATLPASRRAVVPARRRLCLRASTAHPRPAKQSMSAAPGQATTALASAACLCAHRHWTGLRRYEQQHRRPGHALSPLCTLPGTTQWMCAQRPARMCGPAGCEAETEARASAPLALCMRGPWSATLAHAM